MSWKPSWSDDSCLSRSVLMHSAPLFFILTFVCLCVLEGSSAWEQHVTAPTEDSHCPTIATGPVFPDQHHLLEGSPLVGSAGPVCGTGVWLGLFCPVLVLLDVCWDTWPWGKEGGGEECLLGVQPGLRSHPGHPDRRAAGARVTFETPGGEIGPCSAVLMQLDCHMTLSPQPWAWTCVTCPRLQTACVLDLSSTFPDLLQFYLWIWVLVKLPERHGGSDAIYKTYIIKRGYFVSLFERDDCRAPERHWEMTV